MAHAPPSDNVFVGDLPSTISKEMLESVMSAYGSVVVCKVLPPKQPGHKAAGLVRFSSVEEATWVVENLNGNLPEGLQEPIIARFANSPGANAPGAGTWGGGMGGGGGGWGGGKGAPQMPWAGGKGGASASQAVKQEAPPSDNVFFGSLPGSITKEMFETIVSAYGNVTSSRVMPPKAPGGKASALARFSSVEEATWIVQNINGNLVEGLQEPVLCRFANPPGTNPATQEQSWPAPWNGGAAAMHRPSPYGKGAGKMQAAAPACGGGYGKAQGKGAPTFYALYGAVRKAGLLGELVKVPEDCQVFVSPLPQDTSDLDLFRLFSPFGAIAQSGVKAMLGENGLCKGFGFVDFADSATAGVAVQTLNGFMLPDGSTLTVSIKKSKQDQTFTSS